MQLPVAFFFGYLTDFGVWAVQGISYDNYWQQWILCLIGILLVAVGVSMEVRPEWWCWQASGRAGRNGGGGSSGGADRETDGKAYGEMDLEEVEMDVKTK